MIENEYISRVNPTYNTAQQTLYMLAAAKNDDALKYIINMDIENGLQEDIDRNEVINNIDDDDIERITVGMSLGVECRYERVSKLLESSDTKAILDIGCGYTPRALYAFKAGYDYIGVDLPIVVEKMNEVARKLKMDMKHDVYFSGDATNPKKLLGAADMLEGEVFITSEGLLYYFSENELEQMIEGVKLVLQKHGGAWYSSDMEVLYDEMAETMVSDPKIFKIYNDARYKMAKESTIYMEAANFVSIKDKLDFFENRGLKVERLPLYDDDIKLNLLELYPEKKKLQEKVLSKCNIWKMTLKDDAKDVPIKNVEQDGITISAKRSNDCLEVEIGGRVDTLSSPILLMVFEEENEEESLKQMVIDAKELEYISSAGLRTLLIAVKTMGNNSVKIVNANNEIKNIFETTGFDSIIDIE